MYLHLLDCQGQPLTLPNLPAKILRASLLTGGDVSVQQTDSELRIAVPASACQPIDTIIQLELDRPAVEIAPIAWIASPKATASDVPASRSL